MHRQIPSWYALYCSQFPMWSTTATQGGMHGKSQCGTPSIVVNSHCGQLLLPKEVCMTTPIVVRRFIYKSDHNSIRIQILYNSTITLTTDQDITYYKTVLNTIIIESTLLYNSITTSTYINITNSRFIHIYLTWSTIISKRKFSTKRTLITTKIQSQKTINPNNQLSVSHHSSKLI
jgi:hypothetical protein